MTFYSKDYVNFIINEMNNRNVISICIDNDIYRYSGGKRILGRTGKFLQKNYPKVLSKIIQKEILENQIMDLTGIN